MNQISNKATMIGAASVLGLAMVAGGAYAARGSLTVADAPGTVLQVSGVGSASAHAIPTDTAPANPSAGGSGGATTAHPTARATTQTTNQATSQATAVPQSGVNRVAPPAAQMLPTHHAEIHSPEPAHSSSHM